MSIVRIDPEGRRNAKHIAIIIVVDLVPIQSHFRSRRPQVQQPLYMIINDKKLVMQKIDMVNDKEQVR